MGLTYVDSCILIDALTSSGSRGTHARELLQKGQAADQLAISPIVELECMVHPLRSADKRRIVAAKESLGRFRKLPIRASAFRIAADLRARHRFQTADALHIAAAGEGGCAKFWTTDDRLLQAWPHFIVNPYIEP